MRSDCKNNAAPPLNQASADASWCCRWPPRRTCDTAGPGPDDNPFPAHRSAPQLVTSPPSTTRVTAASKLACHCFCPPPSPMAQLSLEEQLVSRLIQPRRWRDSRYGHGVRQRRGSSCSGVAQPEPGQQSPGAPVVPSGRGDSAAPAGSWVQPGHQP